MRNGLAEGRLGSILTDITLEITLHDPGELGLKHKSGNAAIISPNELSILSGLPV